MTDKPSKNEEEYFAREDADRLRHLREQNAADRTAEERRTHFMRCPKCGGALQTESIHGIQVDRCPDCHGIWLDHGELEQLVKHKDPSALGRLMSDVAASLRKLRAT